MTTKEKIDQALGLGGGKSVDQMLDELDQQVGDVKKSLDDIDQLGEKTKLALEKIDEKETELKGGAMPSSLALSDMNSSLKEVEDMIFDSKKVFKHICENITMSDLIDSELVQGCAKLIEALHCSISEFTSIYKKKLAFVEKLKLMIFQQEQKKELMALKQKYDLEKMQMKSAQTGDAIEVDGVYSYNYEDLIKAMTSKDVVDIDFDDEKEDDEDSDEKEDDEKPVKKKK